jgi:hypothetical protein
MVLGSFSPKTTMVKFNDEVLYRLETVAFLRLFTREGDLECTVYGNTDHRGLRARASP